MPLLRIFVLVDNCLLVFCCSCCAVGGLDGGNLAAHSLGDSSFFGTVFGYLFDSGKLEGGHTGSACATAVVIRAEGGSTSLMPLLKMHLWHCKAWLHSLVSFFKSSILTVFLFLFLASLFDQITSINVEHLLRSE